MKHIIKKTQGPLITAQVWWQEPTKQLSACQACHWLRISISSLVAGHRTCQNTRSPTKTRFHPNKSYHHIMSKNVYEKWCESLESKECHFLGCFPFFAKIDIPNLAIGTLPAQWLCGFGWWPGGSERPRTILKNFAYRLQNCRNLIFFPSTFSTLSKNGLKIRTYKEHPEIQSLKSQAVTSFCCSATALGFLKRSGTGAGGAFQGIQVAWLSFEQKYRSTAWKKKYTSGWESPTRMALSPPGSVSFEAGSLSTFLLHTGILGEGSIPKHTVYAALSASTNLSAAWHWNISALNNVRTHFHNGNENKKTLYVIIYCNETSLWGWKTSLISMSEKNQQYFL